jgi:predicted nucleic acid-binding protein
MIAVDSSVIVAALLAWHEKHQPAVRALERALGSRYGVVIPSHVLVESYAVMTRLPAPHRLAPSDALHLLRDNFASVRLATFNARSVWPALQRLAAAALGGGITYDAIILDAAADAGATELLTLNERDYLRLEPALRIVAV